VPIDPHGSKITLRVALDPLVASNAPSGSNYSLKDQFLIHVASDAPVDEVRKKIEKELASTGIHSLGCYKVGALLWS
jgi:hypothetical protein